MNRRRDLILTLAPATVFLLLPVVLVIRGPVQVAPFGRSLYIALLVAGLLCGLPGLVLWGIVLVLRLARGRGPVTIDQLGREQRLMALAAGFIVATMTFTLATNFSVLAPIYLSLVVAYVLYSVPSSARRLAYRSAVVVRRSPEEVFAFVSSPRNWPRYYPEYEIAVEEPIDEPLRVGSTIRLRLRFRGHLIEAAERVTEFEPYRRFASQVIGPHSDDGHFEFTPMAGGTEVAYSYQNVMTVSQAVLGGSLTRRSLLREMIARRDASMQLIKEVLEAGSSGHRIISDLP